MTVDCWLFLQDNEVAAVQPPPVVHYSQDHTANNGAEQISPPHQPIEFPRSEPENRNPNPPDSRYPDPRYPPYTDSRYNPVQPEIRYPVQPERNPITPARRPSPPVNQPEGHTHTSGPGVSSVDFITTFAKVPFVYLLFWRHFLSLCSCILLPWILHKWGTWEAFVGQTSCASSRLGPWVWREHSEPSCLPNFRISTVSSANPTERHYRLLTSRCVVRYFIPDYQSNKPLDYTDFNMVKSVKTMIKSL